MNNDNERDLSAGDHLERYEEGEGGPSLFSAEDANRLVDVINAFLKLEVKIKNLDGSSTKASGKFIVSNQNSIIEITLDGSGGSGSGASITEYDQTLGYEEFEIVRVQPDNDAAIQEGGTTIAGCYFAKQTVPAGGTAPKHPLQSGGENEFWGWLSTWPSLRQDCDSSGNPIETYNDSQEAE